MRWIPQDFFILPPFLPVTITSVVNYVRRSTLFSTSTKNGYYHETWFFRMRMLGGGASIGGWNDFGFHFYSIWAREVIKNIINDRTKIQKRKMLQICNWSQKVFGSSHFVTLVIFLAVANLFLFFEDKAIRSKNRNVENFKRHV